MALFKIHKGKQENLPESYTEGYAYFTTDTSRFYIDTTNSQSGRTMINPDAIVNISRNGTTFTATKVDGTTMTFTQQDNNTTYSAGTGISLSGTTFSLNVSGAKTALGLGSNAYTSTAYLPLTGGTLTGALNIQKDAYPQIRFKNDAGIYRGLVYYAMNSGEIGTLCLRLYTDDTGDNYKTASLNADGIFSATGFSGSGAGLSSLNASNITSGTIAEARLPKAYLPLTGGTVTGTLILSNTTDAAGNADNGPALIVGGTRTTAHIEIDPNEIICKTDATTETELILGHTKGITVAGASTFNSALTSKGYYYQNRNVGSSAAIYFHRNANHAETMTTNSGKYSHVLKANGSADVGMMYFNIPYASTRTTVKDGTVDDNFVAKGYFHFRTYSIDSSTGAKLNYYYSFQFPATPADLTANKTYYAMYQTSSGITSTTSKRYVMGISAANGSVGYNASVYTSGSVLYGACWNDYAEYRNQIEEIKPGYITYSEDDGKLRLTTERLQTFEGIVSDTFGYAIGETEENKTPLAVSGRALVYCDPDDNFHSGDCVCAGPGGLAYRMTREEIVAFPDRIVGIVSEIPTYETWGTGNVEVNGRIWVKVR